MSENKFTQLNLSVDEIAMLFSLINQPELGKSVMLQAYGELEASVMDEKLTTASHSLLARDLASITEKNTVQLKNGVEPILFPMVKFDNILQVTINANQPEGPEIINVYLGKDNNFTVLRIHLGVIYKLTHGEIVHLSELVASWLDLPEKTGDKLGSFDKDLEISMPLLASLDSFALQKGVSILEENGFDAAHAKAIIQDSQNPEKRGSVMLTDITSDNYKEKNLEQGGAGFLYLEGKQSSWLFAFEEANDSTIAKVLPGTASSATAQLSKILAD